jgi:hypothetical protein
VSQDKFLERFGYCRTATEERQIAVRPAGIALSSHACTILEFGAENLLNSAQNTPEINFQELEAFAAGLFSTRPIFTGTEPRFETGLNRAIDLTGFDYAAVHYAPGSSGDPTFNRGGSLVFYHLRPDAYSFIFPQAGPGNDFSNGPITSVTPFFLSRSQMLATVLSFSRLGSVVFY